MIAIIDRHSAIPTILTVINVLIDEFCLAKPDALIITGINTADDHSKLNTGLYSRE